MRRTGGALVKVGPDRDRAPPGSCFRLLTNRSPPNGSLWHTCCVGQVRRLGSGVSIGCMNQQCGRACCRWQDQGRAASAATQGACEDIGRVDLLSAKTVLSKVVSHAKQSSKDVPWRT